MTLAEQTLQEYEKAEPALLLSAAKSEKMGDFELVRKGEKQSGERDAHQAGVPAAVTDYCGQRTGHSRGRRISHQVLGKGCLQKYQRRRQRKGCRRQAEDKDIEKTLFLKAEQRKRTDY